jgi:hypothetical protein
MENTHNSDKSVVMLIRELRDETTTLLQQEVALAKTEISEKAKCFGRNALYMALGGLVAFAGLLFILFSIAELTRIGLERAGASPDTAAWLGPGIVGVVIAAVGYILVQKAIHTFSHESFAPEKTIQSLKEDKQWTQEKLSRT